MAEAGCSSQIPVGKEAEQLGERTLCSETLEHLSCTEAKLVSGGKHTGGSQGSEQKNNPHEFPV